MMDLGKIAELAKDRRLYELGKNLSKVGAFMEPIQGISKEKPNEQDPNGIAAGQPGAKLDAGKVDVGLLFESFPNALLAVAEVATFGAAKYSRGGWKEVNGGLIRYAAAEGRHKLYRYAGETHDKDSKLPHRYHEVWNALAQLEFAIKSGDFK